MSADKVEETQALVIGQRLDGKRYYSDAGRRRVVEQCLRPGASVSAVAIANGLNTNLVRKWIIRYGRTETKPAATALLPVTVERTDEVASREHPMPARACAEVEARIEIELSGMRIIVYGSIEPKMLRTVIEALAHR